LVLAYIASDIKGMNRKIVYDLFLSKNEMSKSEISRETGISAPTVMKIVDYLKKFGCIKEIGKGRSSVGRRPNFLQFDPSAGYAIGVDFSGVEMKIGIVDFGYHLCCFEQFSTQSDFKQVLNHDFPLQVRDLLEKSQIPHEKIRGICIGVPGVVNTVQQTIELAPLVGIIKKQDYGVMASRISDSLHMPVTFENDANVAAIGEFTARKYTAADDLLFITIGKGLGAGIILNGKLRKGGRAFAGELGYMVFSKEYQVKPDEAGWLEREIQLDSLRSEKEIDMDSLNNLACNLALAIVNICVPLEIGHVVLGRFKDDAFYRLLLQKINFYLRSLSTLGITCEPPRCKEPAVLGGAHLIVESVLDDLFGT
jgi:predicted NBD/HSP70 family sugar kinase